MVVSLWATYCKCCKHAAYATEACWSLQVLHQTSSITYRSSLRSVCLHIALECHFGVIHHIPQIFVRLTPELHKADGFCNVCLSCQVFGSDAGEDAYSEGGSGAVSISPRGNAYAGQYEQATSSHVSNRESHQTAQVIFCNPVVDVLLMPA